MTTRKRSSGFSTKEESVSEDTNLIEELVSEQPVELPFIEQEIAPTPDLGSRFSEEPAQPSVLKVIEEPQTPVALGKVPPKRHPRNIPKFSRSK